MDRTQLEAEIVDMIAAHIRLMPLPFDEWSAFSRAEGEFPLAPGRLIERAARLVATEIAAAQARREAALFAALEDVTDPDTIRCALTGRPPAADELAYDDEIPF